MPVSKAIPSQQSAESAPTLALAVDCIPKERIHSGEVASQPWFKLFVFLGSDVATVCLAHEVAERLTLHWLGISAAVFDPPHYLLFYLPFFVSVFYFFGGYKEFDFRRPERELELGVKSISFFFLVLLTANFALFKSWEFSRYLVVCWYAATLLFTLGTRFILRGVYAQLWSGGFARQPALVIGSADRLKALYEELSVQGHSRHKIIGALVQGAPNLRFSINSLPWPMLGELDDWERISRHHGVRCLLMSLPDLESRIPQFVDVLQVCRNRGIEVELHSEIFSAPQCLFHKDEFSGYFRFSSRRKWSRSLHKSLKFMGEMFVGLVGSLVTLLITPVVALLLKIEDGGPVFYRREFVDCDGAVRHYLKFRSMIQYADERLSRDSTLKAKYAEKHKLQDDPRVLRIGRILRKFSIDEFPQFFSVLQCRLALVGPRVISEEESIRYGEFLPKLLSVKPGMTGYWQVMGRQNTGYEERIRMDMFYIDHWSLWLDLVVFAKTFWKVLRTEGAY